MKTKILIFALFILVISGLEQVQSQEPLPDTVWTKDLWQLGYPIYQVQFTPDQQNIAVALGGGVYIFDRNTGEQVKQFKISNTACRYFTFSEDGTKLIVSYDDDKIIVWDYLTTDTIHVFENIMIEHIKSYDEDYIIGIWDLGKICKFDINTGEVVKYIEISLSNIAFEISKENNIFTIITISGPVNNRQRYVEIWDLSTFINISRLGTIENQISDISISPDGKYIASADENGIIKVWDINSKTLLKTFKHSEMENGYIQVKFSPRSDFLISSGGSGLELHTTIWKIDNFTNFYTYNSPFGSLNSFDILKDSTQFIIGGGNKLYLLNAKWTTTDVQNPEEEQYKQIYPNPSEDKITIPITQGLIPLKINITNLYGAIIKEFDNIKPFSDSITVDISGFPPGTYYVSVVYPRQIIDYKFEIVR